MKGSFGPGCSCTTTNRKKRQRPYRIADNQNNNRGTAHSANPNMTLDLARKYSARIYAWLQPTTERVMITGSIRRERPQCADVDLCVIPKTTVYRDLFGNVTGTQNHCWQFLVNYVQNYRPGQGAGRDPAAPARLPAQLLAGGDHPGQRLTVQLPACQLDLWFATPETWASVLIQSTGSREHNQWLAGRAQERGLHWFVTQGLAPLAKVDPRQPGAPRRARDAGHILPAADETQFYSHLGLAHIDPRHRELPWLQKNIARSADPARSLTPR